jgi:TIR domain
MNPKSLPRSPRRPGDPDSNLPGLVPYGHTRLQDVESPKTLLSTEVTQPTPSWKELVRLMFALREFDDEALASLSKDLEIDFASLPGKDADDRMISLGQMFLEQDKLDLLENAIKRAQAVRGLQRSLPPAPEGTIVLFTSYSHKDEKLRAELQKDLEPLREGSVRAWYDGKILPGDKIDSEVEQHLNEAHIILLLVSRDFLNSRYIRMKELPRALERHDAGEARVIPIILRPAPWQNPPWDAMFGKLKALPRDGKPVVKWRLRDDAFVDVYRSIQETISALVKDTRPESKSTS